GSAPRVAHALVSQYLVLGPRHRAAPAPGHRSPLRLRGRAWRAPHVDPRVSALLRGRTRAALHGKRDELPSPVGRREWSAVREGRLSRVPGPGQQGGGERLAGGDEDGGALPGRRRPWRDGADPSAFDRRRE